MSRLHALFEDSMRTHDCSACCHKRDYRASVHNPDSAVLALQDEQAPARWVCQGARTQDGVFDHVEDALARPGEEGSDLSGCDTPEQQQGKVSLPPQQSFLRDSTSISKQPLSTHMLLRSLEGHSTNTKTCLAMSWQVYKQKLTCWRAYRMATLSRSQTAAPWA